LILLHTFYGNYYFEINFILDLHNYNFEFIAVLPEGEKALQMHLLAIPHSGFFVYSV